MPPVWSPDAACSCLTPYLHLQIARGEVDLEGAGPVAAGDAVRLTAVGGQRVTATGPAEVLV